MIVVIVGSHEEIRGSLDHEILTLKSSSGATCAGRFRVGDMGYGFGNMRCSDGRFGSFTGDIQGSYGSAYGRLGGSEIKLIIG